MTPRLRDGVIKRGATWSFVIRVTDPETGLSTPRWVGGFANEVDAKAARDEARVKAHRGEYIDRSRVTVAQYLDEWLDAHSVVVKPKTLRDYRDLVTWYVKPQLGSVPLQALRPARVTKLYRDLLASGGKNGKGLSPRTVDYVHAVLRKAFNDAVTVDRLLISNPVERAKRPRRPRLEPVKVWTPTELNAFLLSAEQHRLFAFYRLAAFTGARRGELLNLRWAEVDLDQGEIRVCGSTDVIDGVRVEGTTKSGRSRVVSIDEGTVRVLREHKARQHTEGLAVGAEWRGDGQHVFTTAWGENVYPDTVTALMADLVRIHNRLIDAHSDPLPPARLHDLRHVHATTLLLAGVPIHVVAARLGHADPSITLRVYAHVLNEQIASAADVFAQVMTDVKQSC